MLDFQFGLYHEEASKDGGISILVEITVINKQIIALVLDFACAISSLLIKQQQRYAGLRFRSVHLHYNEISRGV